MASNEPWCDNASDDSDKRLEKAQELLGKLEGMAKSLAGSRFVTATTNASNGIVAFCNDGSIWLLTHSDIKPSSLVQLGQIPQP